MSQLIRFDQAIKETNSQKRHLILGNGFSIACRPDVFSYNTLYNQADFSGFSHIEDVFDVLNTHDFEVVINALEKAAQISPIYDGDQKVLEQMKKDALSLKHLLVDTVANNHPARPNDISDQEFKHCRSFLSYFLNDDLCAKCSVYSLNYDLLLYWAFMHKEDELDPVQIDLKFNDGFNHDFMGFEADSKEAIFAPNVTWQGETQSHHQNIHYLHGALHLYDEGSELRKYTWNDTGIALTEQARYSIENGFFPLFVSEGTTEKKLDKIVHSAYLHKAYRSFVSNTLQSKASFFTYGYSFSENDEHISKRIGEGTCKALYVGIYGDINTPENKRILEKVEILRSKRSERYKLEVKYYDAESAKVWG